MLGIFGPYRQDFAHGGADINGLKTVFTVVDVPCRPGLRT